MSGKYDDTNKGALFGNNRKRDGKKDPDLQGKLNIDGTERWISGWFFTYEKDGEKKRGINLKIGDEVDQQTQAMTSREKQRQAVQAGDDDIPFR